MSGLSIALASVPDITSVFQSSIDKIATDYNGLVTVALPVGLAIMAVGLVVSLGVKFFRKITK